MANKEQGRVLRETEFDPAGTQEQTGGWPKQVFHLSHLREEDFTNDGFRSYTVNLDGPVPGSPETSKA